MFERIDVDKLIAQRWKGVCVSIIAIAVLSGCEGVHLYDKGKDETATAINKKKTEIDIEKLFKTERDNLQTLLDHEIGVRNRFVENVRSREIWKFIYERQTLGSVLRPDNNYAGRRLRQLGVAGSVTLDTAANAYASLDGYFEIRGGTPEKGTAAQAVLNNTLAVLRDRNSINWEKPYSCAVAITKTTLQAVSDSKVKPEFKKSFRKIFDNYQKLCSGRNIHIVFVENVLSTASTESLFAQSFSEFKSALTELKDLESQVKATKKLLSKKKKPGETKEDYVDRLQKGATKTAESLGLTTSAVKTLGFEKVQTEERVAALSIILRAFGGGALPDLSETEKNSLDQRPGLHRAAIVAAGLPGLAGDVKKLNAFLSEPIGRAGLAIQFGYQKLKLKYLNRRVELVNQRSQLAADQLRAHLYEAVLIQNSGRALDFAGKALEDRKKFILDAARNKKEGPLTEVEKEAALKTAKINISSIDSLDYFQVQALPKSKAKRLVMEGVMDLDLSISVARQRADALYHRLVDTRHQEVNAVDAFAARAWKNLLDGPIQQIQTYHAAGIKSEEISEIVSSLTGLGLLGFIGAKEAN